MKRALLLLALLAPGVPALAEHCGTDGVGLQVLGSAGPELIARRAANSHLLWVHGKARVLVDAGGGAALRFTESGAHLRDLDALVLTSLYADHTSDLPALVQATAFEARDRNLPIFGPPGNRQMPATVAFVRDLFDSTRGAWRHLGDYLAPLARSSYKLAARDVRPAPARLGAPRPTEASPLMSVFSNDALQIRAVAASHNNAPALALRIDVGGKSIVFAGEAQTGDPALTALADEADLLIVQHAHPQADDSTSAATPSAIGRLAQATHSKQVLLVHRTPVTHGQEDNTLAAIRRSFAGPVVFAEDLGCYRL